MRISVRRIGAIIFAIGCIIEIMLLFRLFSNWGSQFLTSNGFPFTTLVGSTLIGTGFWWIVNNKIEHIRRRDAVFQGFGCALIVASFVLYVYVPAFWLISWVLALAGVSIYLSILSLLALEDTKAGLKKRGIIKENAD